MTATLWTWITTPPTLAGSCTLTTVGSGLLALAFIAAALLLVADHLADSDF